MNDSDRDYLAWLIDYYGDDGETKNYQAPLRILRFHSDHNFASSLTLKKLIDKVNVLGFYLTAEKQIPSVKIIHHVLIYEVPLHVITDICHTTP